MKLPLSELNLLIVLLSAAIVLIFILSYKIKLLKNERNRILNENQEDSKILFLQSRYASMGETVGNIAHQWKQPLNAIGSIQTSIKAALIFQGEISKEKLLDSVETSFKLLQHLAETIDTFYSFLSQRNSEHTSFVVSDELEAIRKITEYSFENSRIKLEFILDTNPMIQGNANEFTHAMLNLILNAKEAFDLRNINVPTIIVHVSGGENTCTIKVFDNAGGIRIEPINMVFDLHISTKEEGSGLGLFMTKNIIENRFGGTINVENKNDGTCFTITLPYAQYGEHFFPVEPSDEKLTLERINQLSRKVIELEEVKNVLTKWAEIFEHSQWGIVIGNIQDQSFEVMNPTFAAMHGFSVKELTGKKIESVFAPEYRDQLKFVIETTHREGYYAFESVHIRKDGSRFPVAIELMAIKDESGTVLYRVANVWDITKRKEAEERLLLKRFALDHIKDAIFMIDENARFHYINEAACNALGYTHQEFAQMNIEDIDPQWPQERWSQHWNELKKVGSMTMKLQHRRKDGSTFPVEVSANYIEYEGRSYNMAIARDITERLLLQEQKDNERMKLFFERQLVGMAITSPQKGWLHTNEKLQEMLGYTHEELTRLTWVEMTYPEDLAPDIEQFERLLRAEIEDYILEKRFIRKDGTIVYTNLAVSCVRNDDRSANYVLALLEDITERKELEALLEKERKFLIDAQRVAHTGSWYLDIQNGGLSWSDETYQIFELDKEDVHDLHKTFYERVHPDDQEMVNAPYVESLETKLPYEVEHRIVMSDGRIKYVIERCEHRYDDNGTPLYSIGTVQDITERKLMEMKLKDSHNFLNQLVNSIHDPIFVKDREHRWTMLNDANIALTGLPRETLIGKSDYDIFPKEQADIFWEKDEAVFNSGKLNINEEYFTSADGVTHYIETVKSMFVSNSGKEYLVGTIRNITERKAAEDAVRVLNETLEKRVIGRTAQLQEVVTALHKEITERKETEKQLKMVDSAINSSSEAIYINDKYLSILYVNDGACRMLGYTRDELMEMKIYDIDTHFSSDQIFELRDNTIGNKYTFFETKHRTKAGKIIDVEIVGNPFVYEGIESVISVVKDITERKKAAEALNESKQRYKEIFENTSDSIYLMEVTEDGRFRNIAANPAFVHSIGIPLEMLVGSYVGDLTDEETTATVIAKYRRCIEAGVPTEEIAVLDLPVGKKTFCSTLIPIKDETGRVCRIIGLAKDISKAKK